MKLFSTSTFRPLAFLGLLLVVATAFPTTEVQREAASDATTASRTTQVSPQKIEDQMRYMLSEALELRKEMCNNNEECLQSQEAVLENKLNLPELTPKDGCFQKGFNRNNCLTKIASSLLEFNIYMEYTEKIFQESKKEKARVLRISTKALSLVLKQQVQNPDKVVGPSPDEKAALLKKMESLNEWQRNTAIHIILRELEFFLQYGVRAVRQP